MVVYPDWVLCGRRKRTANGAARQKQLFGRLLRLLLPSAAPADPLPQHRCHARHETLRGMGLRSD